MAIQSNQKLDIYKGGVVRDDYDFLASASIASFWWDDAFKLEESKQKVNIDTSSNVINFDERDVSDDNILPMCNTKVGGQK